MTQPEVAKGIGKSASFVSQVENGKRSPSYSTLLKFAKVFNIDPSFLLAENSLTEEQMQVALKWNLLIREDPDNHHLKSIKALLDMALAELHQ